LLWWQLRRLRLAIEFDCDRRVLGHGVSPLRYGEAMLRVGSELTRTPLAATAFAEPPSNLERRVSRLWPDERRAGGLRSAAGGVGALALLALSCQAPPPVALEEGTQDVPILTADVVVLEADVASPTDGAAEPDVPEPIERPSFIPFDTPPVLTNVEVVRAALEDEYPADLRDGGVGGRVELWLFIDESGTVGKSQVKTSSGNAQLDDAASTVAESMTFRPAINRDQSTPVWVSQWITFEPAADRASEKHRPDGEADATADEPVIIVDGVIQPDDASLADLRALDIDQVEVIKGEAATELYGDWARDGVILIATKAATRVDASPPDGK